MRTTHLLISLVFVSSLLACGQKVKTSGVSHSSSTASQSSVDICFEAQGAYHVRLQRVEMRFDPSTARLSAQIDIANLEGQATTPNVELDCSIFADDLATGARLLLQDYPWDPNPVYGQSPLYGSPLMLAADEIKVVTLSALVPRGLRPATFGCALGATVPGTGLSSLSKCYDGNVLSRAAQ